MSFLTSETIAAIKTDLEAVATKLYAYGAMLHADDDGSSAPSNFDRVDSANELQQSASEVRSIGRDLR